MKAAIIILIILLIIFIIWQTYELRQFDVTHYYINTPKITRSHRICVVSDLHQHSYGKFNEELVASIKAQEPDIILIPGDLIVDTKPYQYGVSSSFISKISKIAPIYFSNGNHEKRLENPANPNHIHYKLYQEALEHFNMYTLNNRGTRFDDELEIYGLDLPVTYFTKGKKHRLSTLELMHMLNLEIGENPDSGNPTKTERSQDTIELKETLGLNEIKENNEPVKPDNSTETTEEADGSFFSDGTDRNEKNKQASENITADISALESEMKSEISDEKLGKLLDGNSQMASLYNDLMNSKHESARRTKKKRDPKKHRSLLASMVFADADRLSKDVAAVTSNVSRSDFVKRSGSSAGKRSTAFPDDEKYRILLAHSPEFGETYAEAGFDLSLCGHYHGGLVCTPSGKAIFSAHFTLFPDFSAGDTVVQGRHVITSRGLGTHTFNIRVFNRAELVVIHLMPEGANDAFKYKDPFDDIDFTAL